jgi:dolichol-phosphate mannosyltransferase
MLMTGIMGLYIGRIHAEVKRRPLYVVSQRLGFERETKEVRALLSASAN